MISYEENVTLSHFIVKIIDNDINISYNDKRFGNDIRQSNPRG